MFSSPTKLIIREILFIPGRDKNRRKEGKEEKGGMEGGKEGRRKEGREKEEQRERNYTFFDVWNTNALLIKVI